MKAIEFYKYIHENNIEYHWTYNIETNERDVLFFPYYWQIEDLSKLLTAVDLDEDGIGCVMKDRYFAFWASDIIEPYDILLTDIFGKDILAV